MRFVKCALVVEPVDTQASGACESNLMEVRVLSRAHYTK